MESLLENLSLNDEEKIEATPSQIDGDVELNLEAPPSRPALPQYNLPPELSVHHSGCPFFDIYADPFSFLVL